MFRRQKSRNKIRLDVENRRANSIAGGRNQSIDRCGREPKVNEIEMVTYFVKGQQVEREAEEKTRVGRGERKIAHEYRSTTEQTHETSNRIKAQNEKKRSEQGREEEELPVQEKKKRFDDGSQESEEQSGLVMVLSLPGAFDFRIVSVCVCVLFTSRLTDIADIQEEEEEEEEEEKEEEDEEEEMVCGCVQTPRSVAYSIRRTDEHACALFEDIGLRMASNRWLQVDAKSLPFKFGKKYI